MLASSLGSVALLAEGVDRNILTRTRAHVIAQSPSSRRAWIEIALLYAIAALLLSPSSRRAWIEMLESLLIGVVMPVALLAEGVDRNPLNLFGIVGNEQSPSSRRAWIEIVTHSR